MSEKTFRQQVIERLRSAFGTPQEARFESGIIYRWKLDRPGNEVALIITLDSPEREDVAHVIISDSQRYSYDTLESITLRTLEETEALARRLEHQWKAKPREMDR